MGKQDDFEAERSRVADATFGKGTSETQEFKDQTAGLKKLIADETARNKK